MTKKQERILSDPGQACFEYNQLLNFSSSADSKCYGDFDKSMCWLPVERGVTVQQDCPFTFCSTRPGCDIIQREYQVYRTCLPNGTWKITDYTQCIRLGNMRTECVRTACNECPDFEKDMTFTITVALSIISVVLLITAIVLFSVFDSIQCRRLSIHKHLALAFVFRFSSLALWLIVHRVRAFNDCTQFHSPPIPEFEWLCRTFLLTVIYFQVASVMWMLIEGVFLYSRFTVLAMRHSDAPWWFYLACGWGFPLIVVILWAYVHVQNYTGNYCWMPYTDGPAMWILAGTMGIAFIMNLIFLLAIVFILVQKLRTENSAESKKIWRTIKATLLLVPLLGVSNIPLFYEPPKSERTGLYMIVSTTIVNSQGIFVAVFYCFLNSEIQGAVKRQLAKIPIGFFKPRNHFETERTYVPENRNGPSKNGVPMEELNGTKKLKPTDENGQDKDESAKRLWCIMNNGANQIYSVTTKSEDSL